MDKWSQRKMASHDPAGKKYRGPKLPREIFGPKKIRLNIQIDEELFVEFERIVMRAGYPNFQSAVKNIMLDMVNRHRVARGQKPIQAEHEKTIIQMKGRSQND